MDTTEDPQPRSSFAPKSVGKVAVLTLASFGFYAIWWFYHQWTAYRDKRGLEIRPLPRAILSGFTAFSLFPKIDAELAEHSSTRSANSGLTWAVIYFCSLLGSRLPEPWHLLMFGATVLPIAVMQTRINRIERAVAPNYVLRDKFGFGSGVLVSFGAILWVLLVWGLNTTSSSVQTGEEMDPDDVSYLRSSGYVGYGEEIIFFYSIGLWSIAEDGNILTDERVVSYSKNANSEYHEYAAFYDIYSVDAHFSDSWLDDTTVMVTRKDGVEILLYLSTEGGLDKSFVERLEREWRLVVPEGTESLDLPDPTPPFTSIDNSHRPHRVDAALLFSRV